MFFGADTVDRRFFVSVKPFCERNVRELDKPKPVESKNLDTQRAGRVGTAQGGRRGGATLGRTRCRHFGRLGSQLPLWPLRAIFTTVLNVSSQAQTRKILCKLLREQNVRLTTGLSAVYPQFINGTTRPLRCWLLTSVPTPICLCKPFSCKACLGKIMRAFPGHVLQHCIKLMKDTKKRQQTDRRKISKELSSYVYTSCLK